MTTTPAYLILLGPMLLLRSSTLPIVASGETACSRGRVAHEEPGPIGRT